MPVSVLTGAVEPLAIFVVGLDARPLTALTDLYVRIRRRSDGLLLDWNDSTFKAAGWTTLNKILTEVSATNAPGLYAVTGNFNTAAITNPVADDIYIVIPLQTPGTNAQLPAPDELRMGRFVDQISVGYGKLPTNNFMGSAVKTDKDDEIDAIKAKTDLLPASPANEVTSAAIKAKTDLLPASPANEVTVAAVKAKTDLLPASPANEVTVAAVKAKTDNLPLDPADESNQLAQHSATQSAISALNNLSQAGVQSALTAQGYTTGRATKLDALDADVSTRATQAQILSDVTPFAGASISLIKTKTDYLPTDPASETNATANRVAVIAEVDVNEGKIDDVQADVTTILADTSALDARVPSDPADESSQMAQHVATQAAIAALQDLSEADVQSALTTQGYTAARALFLDHVDTDISSRATVAGVWDEALSGHLASGSTGKALQDAGATADPAVIADAVWNEALAGHGVAGSAGAAQVRLDATISSRATPGAAMDLIAGALDANSLDGTAAAEIADAVWDEPLVGHTGSGTSGQAAGRVDATMTSRAAPGAAMTLAPNAIDSSVIATSGAAELADAVWDEALVGHAGVGSAGEAQARVDVAVSTRSAPGAAMALTAPAVAGVSDAVWDEVLGGHLVAGSTGKALDDAGAVGDPSLVAAAVWDTVAASHVVPGTVGQLQSRLDAVVSSRAAPGAPMSLSANAVDSTALATSAVNEIRDSILSDATRIMGSRIDASISSRAAPGDTMDLVAGAVNGVSVDVTAVDGIASGVWDESLAGHTGAGTAGKVLTDGSDPAAIAGAVWDEALGAHTAVGSTGEAQARIDVPVSTRAAPGAAMDLVAGAVDASAVATSGANEIRDAILSDATRFAGANIDAAVSSRAVPGGAMALVAGAVSATSVAADGATKVAGATWDEALTGHAGPGTAGAYLGRVDAQVSSRAAPGAAMAVTVIGAEDVAAKVWNEPLAGHVTPGSAGEAQAESVDPAVIAHAVWDEPRTGHEVAGTMGEAQEQSSVSAVQTAKIDQEATVDPSAAAPGSLLDRLCNKDSSRTYNQATDSLEAVRGRLG